MKMEYRRTSVYVPEDVLLSCNRHEDVDAFRFPLEDFKDFNAFKDKYMKHLPKIGNKHVFHVSANKPGTLEFQLSVLDEKTSTVVVKKQFLGKDWAVNMEEELLTIKAPGLPDIKWQELYDKWRPLVPQKKRNSFHYFREDPGLERREKIKAQAKEAQKQCRERSRTKN